MPEQHLREQELMQRLEQLLAGLGPLDTDDEPRRLLGELRERLVFLETRNHDLTRTLREQDRRLRRQVEELTQRDRLRNQFLAVLSHELRNPVGAIRMIAELFKLYEAQFDPDCRSGLQILDRQLSHLGRLLDDLLDMARLNNGRIILQKAPTGLAEVVDHAVQTQQPQFQTRQQSLEVVLSEEAVTVDADPVRLAQALGNLLNNAAKFSEPGARIRLVARHQHHQAVISVHDTGMGLDAETLAHLFEPFGVEDHLHGGLGLGLPLARHLIRLHGGSLVGESPGPGQGSVFTIRLPALLEPTPASRIPAETPPPPTTPGPRRVLVVDDNPDAVEGLARLLTRLGHEVRTALDGNSALGLAAEFHPEAVFLDIGMPGMDGYEVASRLRQQNSRATPHLIALTGYGQEQDRQQARQAGFDDHVVKPANLDILRKLLADLHA